MCESSHLSSRASTNRAHIILHTIQTAAACLPPRKGTHKSLLLQPLRHRRVITLHVFCVVLLICAIRFSIVRTICMGFIYVSIGNVFANVMDLCGARARARVMITAQQRTDMFNEVIRTMFAPGRSARFVYCITLTNALMDSVLACLVRRGAVRPAGDGFPGPGHTAHTHTQVTRMDVFHSFWQ